MLALLPTATANVLAAMDTEKITLEIQRTRSGPSRPTVNGTGSISPPSVGDTTATEDDGRSLTSESGVHASQHVQPGPSDGSKDGDQTTPQKRKSKRQLWDELAISCRLYCLCPCLCPALCRLPPVPVRRTRS